MSLARFAYCTLQWVCGIQIQGLGQKYFLVFSVDWINCSVCIENFSLRVLMDEKRWEPDIWLGVWTSVHLIQLSSKKQNFIKSHTNCHFGPHLCKSFTSPFCRFFVKRSKRNCFASTAKQWRTATLRALQLSVHKARVTYKRSTVPGPKRSLCWSILELGCSVCACLCDVLTYGGTVYMLVCSYLHTVVCSYVYSGVLKEVFFCVSICIRNHAPRITHVVSCMKSVFVA